MTSTDTSKKEAAFLSLGGRLDSIIDGVTKIGVAYAGYKAANHISGGLAALVALQLAKSGNVVAGAAGLATLGLIGATNLYGPSTTTYDNPDTAYIEYNRHPFAP